MLQIQDERSYTEIVDHYADMLYRIAYQNTMNQADAEDVVQDVFLKLLKRRHKEFEDEEHLKAWLMRITINRSRDYGRFRIHRQEEALEPDVIERAAPEERVLEEIRQLPKDERMIVYLHYYEGYKIREIAQLMGKSQNTISSKLTRARGKLKRMLED